MSGASFIRQLYTPVQPTASRQDDTVQYTELQPHTRLMPFVYCYWQLQTCQPLEQPFYYRVVADGCIDVFFETQAPEQLFIMGFSNTYTEFPLREQFHYAGIRFLPAAFPLLFRVNAAVLTNRFERLDQVLPALATGLQAAVAGVQEMAVLALRLDHYFTHLLEGISLRYDARFFEALERILKTGGNLAVETALDTGLSPRQMRRQFEYYIGDTPKTFSKVVRFQQLMNAQPSQQSLRKQKLFFDAGYYDQAHFIKEFRTLFGATPAAAFQQQPKHR